MKIFRDGAIPMPPPCRPFDHGFECFHCHCHFEVEAGDDFKLMPEKRNPLIHGLQQQARLRYSQERRDVH